jgi:hypothetical protein
MLKFIGVKKGITAAIRLCRKKCAVYYVRSINFFKHPYIKIPARKTYGNFYKPSFIYCWVTENVLVRKSTKIL